MGGFNFTGDLKQVRKRQLEFIREVLEKKKMNGPDVKLENVCAPEDSFSSDVKRINITDNGKIFKMIAKLAPDSMMLRSNIHTVATFNTENTIYAEPLPNFVQIQKSAGVVEVFRFAENYGFLGEIPNEVILLEDLKEFQFEIENKIKPLRSDGVKTGLKNLAKFHSLSYVLKHQGIEKFNEIKLKLGDDIHMSPSKDERVLFQRLENRTLSMLDDDKYKKYVTGSVTEKTNTCQKTIEGDIGSKYLVIKHGDIWINNIMINKSKDDALSECVFIDYQFAREGSPAYDILYMIFSSTTHEQRLGNYHDFLNHYHRELDKSLHNYGLKADLVYPRHQLDSDLKRYGRFTFAVYTIQTKMQLK